MGEGPTWPYKLLSDVGLPLTLRRGICTRVEPQRVGSLTQVHSFPPNAALRSPGAYQHPLVARTGVSTHSTGPTVHPHPALRQRGALLVALSPKLNGRALRNWRRTSERAFSAANVVDGRQADPFAFLGLIVVSFPTNPFFYSLNSPTYRVPLVCSDRNKVCLCFEIIAPPLLTGLAVALGPCWQSPPRKKRLAAFRRRVTEGAPELSRLQDPRPPVRTAVAVSAVAASFAAAKKEPRSANAARQKTAPKALANLSSPAGSCFLFCSPVRNRGQTDYPASKSSIAPPRGGHSNSSSRQYTPSFLLARATRRNSPALGPPPASGMTLANATPAASLLDPQPTTGHRTTPHQAPNTPIGTTGNSPKLWLRWEFLHYRKSYPAQLTAITMATTQSRVRLK